MVAPLALSAPAHTAPMSTLPDAKDAGAGTLQSVLPVDPGFTVEAEVAQKFVKGEDIAFCYRADPALLGRSMPSSQPDDPADWKLNYDVFVVCDGHSGVAANEFVRREFLATLQPHMPLSLPPSFRSAAGATYAAAMRIALTRTLETLNSEFCAREELAGCTLTACIVSGQLITVANIGDSDALLDTFSETIPMSVPHRVNDNESEQQRVSDLGALIAPLSVNMDGPAAPGAPGLGPLRIWPGGLCVSRGIGDIDVGEPVIASPHVRQVVVPTWGCRIILASDGVWDCISTRNVISSVRGRTCASACNAVVHKCLRVKQGSLVDDTTCCVVDCRPHNVASFKGYSPEKNTMHSGRAMAATQPIVSQTTQSSAAVTSGVATAPVVSEPEASLTSSNGGTADTNGGAPYTPGEANGKASASGRVDAPARPPSRGSGGGGFFSCCAAPSATKDDDDGGGGGGGGLRDSSKTGIKGGFAHAAGPDDSAHGSVSRPPGSAVEGSRSRNPSGSVARSLNRIGLTRRRACALAPVTLYADVDMAFEALPLATLSESTADADDARPSLEAARHHRLGSQPLDMGFEPPRGSHDVQARGPHDGGNDVRWHSMAPTQSDITTRPHRALASRVVEPAA